MVMDIKFHVALSSCAARMVTAKERRAGLELGVRSWLVGCNDSDADHTAASSKRFASKLNEQADEDVIARWYSSDPHHPSPHYSATYVGEPTRPGKNVF